MKADENELMESEPDVYESDGFIEKPYRTLPKLILAMGLFLVFIASGMTLALNAVTEYKNRNPWSMEIDGMVVQPGVTKAGKLAESGYILSDAEAGWDKIIPARTSATAKIQKPDQTVSCISVALVNESEQEKPLRECAVWAVDFAEAKREEAGIQNILLCDKPLEQVSLQALRKQYGEPEKENEALLYGKTMETYRWTSGQNGLEISMYEDGTLIALQSWHVVQASFGGVKAAEAGEE